MAQPPAKRRKPASRISARLQSSGVAAATPPSPPSAIGAGGEVSAPKSTAVSFEMSETRFRVLHNELKAARQQMEMFE